MDNDSLKFPLEFTSGNKIIPQEQKLKSIEEFIEYSDLVEITIQGPQRTEK